VTTVATSQHKINDWNFFDLLTIENTDSDLKVHSLHYANELLVHVRLSFQNICKLANQAEAISNHQKKVLVMIKHCLWNSQINSVPGWILSCCILKSFSLRDRGRLGNESRPILLKIGLKVVIWTYVICQSFRFNDHFLAEFWISAPQWSPGADFQCNFDRFSNSLLATYK